MRNRLGKRLIKRFTFALDSTDLLKTMPGVWTGEVGEETPEWAGQFFQWTNVKEEPRWNGDGDEFNFMLPVKELHHG